MIEGEFEHSKEMQLDDDDTSHYNTNLAREKEMPKSKRPFLEISPLEGSATGTGITSDYSNNNSLQLQSIWLPILALADEESSAYREGIEAISEELLFYEINYFEMYHFVPYMQLPWKC